MKLKIIKKDDSEEIIEISQYFYDLQNQMMMCELLYVNDFRIIDFKDAKVIAVY